VNELLGTRLASRLGLPTAPVEVIEVGAELIRLTPELCIELPRSRTPCAAGLQFGSRYPGDPRQMTLHDFLPDEKLREVQNLHDFAGMLVFDKWVCNTNGRQTVFFEEVSQTAGRTSGAAAASVTPGAVQGEVARGTLPHGDGARQMLRDGAGDRSREQAWEVLSEEAGRGRAYRTVMIDQGFCFNAGEWNFPDAPLRGLYARSRVYEGVTGMGSFGPWLERLEKRITEKVLAELTEEIPPAWYEDDYDAVLRVLEQLHRRKTRVEELILSAKSSNRQPFARWRE
jgi:hypothetical protein